MRALRFFGVFLVSGALTACGGLEKAGVANTGSNTNAAAGARGYTPPANYPAGPYGYAPGSTIADLTFIGLKGATVNGVLSNQTPGPIHLSDYRSQYKVLAVLAAAGWCGPCNMEQPDMVNQFQAWQSANSGVGILEVLVNDKTPGIPADMSFVDFWATEYSIPFDLGTDPTGVLSPYYDINAFPMNMVVRLSDMNIIWQYNGENISGLQGAVSFALGN